MLQFSYLLILMFNYFVASSCHCPIIPISIVHLINIEFTQNCNVLIGPIGLVKLLLKKEDTHIKILFIHETKNREHKVEPWNIKHKVNHDSLSAHAAALLHSDRTQVQPYWWLKVKKQRAMNLYLFPMIISRASPTHCSTGHIIN